MFINFHAITFESRTSESKTAIVRKPCSTWNSHSRSF